MYKTFKFYNKNHQRCSIFAEQEGDVLHILVIPCSSKDQFSIKKGNELYEKYKNLTITQLINKKIICVDVIVKEFKPYKTFINWCKNNFYRKFTGNITLPCTYLSKVKDRAKTKDVLKIHQDYRTKLDLY